VQHLAAMQRRGWARTDVVCIRNGQAQAVRCVRRTFASNRAARLSRLTIAHHQRHAATSAAVADLSVTRCTIVRAHLKISCRRAKSTHTQHQREGLVSTPDADRMRPKRGQCLMHQSMLMPVVNALSIQCHGQPGRRHVTAMRMRLPGLANSLACLHCSFSDRAGLAVAKPSMKERHELKLTEDPLPS
jgi:hypothetical protein